MELYFLLCVNKSVDLPRTIKKNGKNVYKRDDTRYMWFGSVSMSTGEEKNNLVFRNKDYIHPLSPFLLHLSTYVKATHRNTLGENTL